MCNEKRVLLCLSQMSVGITIGLAFVLNIFFMCCMTHEYHAITMAHGNVAHNFYRYNNPGINSLLAETMHALQGGKSKLIDFDAVRYTDFGLPNKSFPVNDTIGYGVLLGLLWKVTHSLCFRDIVWLQIFMYLIMVYLIYQIGLLFFACKKAAQYATIAFTLYLPLIALNVHAVRDVWAAYGIVVLMYGILWYLHPSTSPSASLRANGGGAFSTWKNKVWNVLRSNYMSLLSLLQNGNEEGSECPAQSDKEESLLFPVRPEQGRRLSSKGFFSFLFGCIFFALCQWIRPSLFLAVITATVALILNTLIKPAQIKKTYTIISILWITNILIFWVPFMQSNKTQYGRYLVSPVGQDLLEGLGEFANPWGHKLSDEYVAQLIENKYGSKYGTPQFDDDAKKEFLCAYDEQPWIFWLNIIKRLPMLILPVLPWLFYEQSPYAVCMDAKKKLMYVITCPSLWLDFFARHIYMRLYIILGYLGLGVLLWHRKYGVVLMIGAVLMASMAKLPSHIEYRYLTPYYWVLCFAIGHVLKEVRHKKYSRTQ